MENSGSAKNILNRFPRIVTGTAVAVTGLMIIALLVLWPELRTSKKNDRGGKMPGNVNFPSFRGEGSRGIGGGTGYPVKWNGLTGENIKWKTIIPLQGKSSPVIWGDRIFLTGAGEGRMELYCIDKTNGVILWTASGKEFPGALQEEPVTDAEAGMAVPTPAVSENKVFAVFGNGNLVCYDHTGKYIWGKNIGLPESVYGFTSSLLVSDNLLIVQYDSQNKISLSGYDTGTGELRWETLRTGKPVNSSPILANFDGRNQVIINGNPDVTAFDVVNGVQLWSLPGLTGDIASSPALNSKLIFVVADYLYLLAIKPGISGGTLWQDNSYTADVSSPVANEKFLFITTGAGDMACYNAEKGDTAWTHYFGESFYASPMICDGKVWALDRSGVMHIVSSDGKKKILGESPLGERADCSPAFSEHNIYIRGMKHLFCIAD